MQAGPAYAVALALAGAQAAACEAPLYDPTWRDRPIKIATDCSFTEADEFPGQSISASHAQNIGNGLIGQVVTVYVACGVYQTLMVVDCPNAGAMTIEAPEGNPPVNFGGSNNREMKDLYAPRGKLRLSATGSLDALEAQAKRYGYDHTRDVYARIDEMKKKNRYDPFCGCPLFYPDSAGAAKAAGRPEKKG